MYVSLIVVIRTSQEQRHRPINPMALLQLKRSEVGVERCEVGGISTNILKNWRLFIVARVHGATTLRFLGRSTLEPWKGSGTT
jgi:hypothetical protein